MITAISEYSPEGPKFFHSMAEFATKAGEFMYKFTAGKRSEPVVYEYDAETRSFRCSALRAKRSKCDQACCHWQALGDHVFIRVAMVHATTEGAAVVSAALDTLTSAPNKVALVANLGHWLRSNSAISDALVPMVKF